MFKNIVNRPYYENLKKLRDKKERNLREVSTLLGINEARVSHIVREWHQEGLINREQDSRELKIQISEKGLYLANQLEDIENELYHKLTEADKVGNLNKTKEDKNGKRDGKPVEKPEGPDRVSGTKHKQNKGQLE